MEVMGFSTFIGVAPSGNYVFLATYAIAMIYAYRITVDYGKANHMLAYNGIF